MSSVDRRMGVTGSVAIKAPCRVATTASISLRELQTIDGIELAAGDRVLVKDQDNAVENGIYVADTGPWLRAIDFNGSRDCVQGTLVSVHSGDTSRATLFYLRTELPVIGVSELVFAESWEMGRTIPFDPAYFRPTGGGVSSASIIADNLYSHFTQLELGSRQRLHEFNYEGPEHGQDSPTAVSQLHIPLAGVDIPIDGSAASGGIAVIELQTRLVVDSVYNNSHVYITAYGNDLDGNPTTETIRAPNNGRTTGTVYFKDGITRLTASADGVGTLSVGFQLTPGKLIYRNSDDYGQTWDNEIEIIDGSSGRGYRPFLMSWRDGTVVVGGFYLDAVTYTTSNVRCESNDNGDTFGPLTEVTFVGLDSGDTTIVFHSRWRQLGGSERQVSVGQSGDRSYFLWTDDRARTINCRKFAEVDHGADNDLSFEIDSLDVGAKTVILKTSEGDVSGYWPNNMSTTVAETGAADGNSYVTGVSYSGGQTRVVLNELVAGTVGANSRLRRLYGPRQILAVDIPTNTIRIEGDQTAEIMAGSGHYIGFNGFSTGGVRYLDGLVSGAVSVTYEPGSPGRTAIVLAQTIPAGTTALPTSRLSDVQLGEWGIGLLTDLDMTFVPRCNGMPSALPRFVTSDGGETITLVGATNIVEGSYVAIEVDFVPGVCGMVEVITAFSRSTTDKYFATSCDARLARTTSEFFSPPWYFLSMPATVNSGYHALVFPRGDGVAIGAFGNETGQSTAQIEAWVIDFAPVLTGVVYASRAPGADDDVTMGFMPGRVWSKYDGSAIYMAKSTAEGAAVWTQIQTVTPGGNSWAYKLTADQSLTTGTTADVLWDSPLGTSNGGVRGNITYDSATGWITVPNGGYMTINGMVRLVPTGATGTIAMLVQVDLDTGSGSLDSLLQFSPPANSPSTDIRFDISAWYIDPGGRVRVRALITATGSAGTPTIASSRSYFTGMVTE